MFLNKTEYLIWAAKHWLRANTSCPSCSSTSVELIRRKYLVTSLYRCVQCRLMYRVPKNSAKEAGDFYQDKYKQGFTTDCPDDQTLTQLLNSGFKDSAKDYTGYIDILNALGLGEGNSILDFGCSWGYGSWQFSQAGYDVYSYEISKSRSQYAVERLRCRVLEKPENVPEKVDCFFSAHVIEHLTNPRILWDQASNVLKSSGLVVLFMPNGEPDREQIDATYHAMWGQVHPLLLCAESLTVMATQYGFESWAYSTPYNLRQISERAPGDLSGDELLFIAQSS